MLRIRFTCNTIYIVLKIYKKKSGITVVLMKFKLHTCRRVSVQHAVMKHAPQKSNAICIEGMDYEVIIFAPAVIKWNVASQI